MRAHRAGRPCEVRRVTYRACASNAAEVVHLEISSRPGQGVKWVHSEHMGAERLKAVQRGATTLSAALADTAYALQRRGEWSLAAQHMRMSILEPRLGALSHATFRGAAAASSSSAAATAPPPTSSAPPLRWIDPDAGVLWRRLDPTPRSANSAAEPSNAEDIVFFATNAIDKTDERLLRHYRAQLAHGMAAPAELWLLLMATPSSAPFARASAATAAAPARALGVPTFVWSEMGLHARLPALAAAVNRSLRTLAAERVQNHARYYYYHASLLLWLEVCASARTYPAIRYLWRLEPDVVFTGSLATLVGRSARVASDVLLPSYWEYEHTKRTYDGHWELNRKAPTAAPDPTGVCPLHVTHHPPSRCRCSTACRPRAACGPSSASAASPGGSSRGGWQVATTRATSVTRKSSSRPSAPQRPAVASPSLGAAPARWDTSSSTAPAGRTSARRRSRRCETAKTDSGTLRRTATASSITSTRTRAVAHCARSSVVTIGSPRARTDCRSRSRREGSDRAAQSPATEGRSGLLRLPTRPSSGRRTTAAPRRARLRARRKRSRNYKLN